MVERFVYALRDPRTNLLLYVGQSSQGLSRPRAHWRPSALKNRENPHLANKLRAILAEGLTPGIEILERAETEGELDEAEVFWIAKCREMGYPLTNVLEGGRKPPRIVMTPEHREKIRQSRLGKPALMLGKKHSEETKRKMSLAHKGRLKGPPKPEDVLKRARTRCRPIVDENGNLYLSRMEAAAALGLKPNSISALLRGRYKTLHGHTLKFA